METPKNQTFGSGDPNNNPSKLIFGGFYMAQRVFKKNKKKFGSGHYLVHGDQKTLVFHQKSANRPKKISHQGFFPYSTKSVLTDGTLKRNNKKVQYFEFRGGTNRSKLGKMAQK